MRPEPKPVDPNAPPLEPRTQQPIPDEVQERLNAEADLLANDPKALIQNISVNVVRMLKQLEYIAFNPPKSRSGPQVQRGAIKDYILLSKEVIEVARAQGLLKED